ncbi:collagen alpha-1(III) chain-like [Boleophthalmus pectinirostris]|uniref:collagen alpha-1(III) chain-like n=1 Tax=Boleophthalmus pectinirostris TaxID=150288 RepID=UPI002430E310|nr:collagen alpha-1(III) chain-like [Boleophthalmus pectinirostris]
MSDTPNYQLVQTLLESLQTELRWFICPPEGTREHPATTCMELWLAQPNVTNGIYFIDPNHGSPADAFQVYCDFTAEPKTCLSPLQSQVPVKPWLKESGAGLAFSWLSKFKDGFEFEYPSVDVVQMRFLRLHSRLSSQTIRYLCAPGSRQSGKKREIKFLSDTRNQSYLSTLRDCEPSGDWGSGSQESVFEFESEDLELLPLRDIAVFGNRDITQDFGFTVGPACFS